MMKRLFDIVVSLLGLIVLMPILLLVASAIFLQTGRPVLFKQDRVGLNGRLFCICKFRTMVTDAESDGQLTVASDARVTDVGQILRKYKLDELPQLWNVLVGDMSVVGPRPEVPRYVAIYSEADKRIVLSVRPGITDNAAIEFRNENDLLQSTRDPDDIYVKEILPRKMELYRGYVANRSIVRDLRIILRTLWTLKR